MAKGVIEFLAFSDLDIKLSPSYSTETGEKD
jgi:hypothetical protein